MKVVPLLCVKIIWQIQNNVANLQHLRPAHAEREINVDHSHVACTTPYSDLSGGRTLAARVLVYSCIILKIL